MDQRKLRARRLENEYNELMDLDSSIISVVPIGEAPYEKYRVTFNLRTIISEEPRFRETTICILTIPSGYPDVVPKLAVDSASLPAPWHPNWYKGGTWCFGTWSKEESLVSYICRCAKTIQFDVDLTASSYDAAANKEAIDFWEKNKNNSAMIPSDRTVLPVAIFEGPKISFL